MTATITLGWMIALIVLLFEPTLLPPDVRWWVWTCVTGVLMGLFGLWYVPFLKRRRAGIAAAGEGQSSSGYVSRDNGSNTVSSTDTPGNSTRS